MNKGFTLIEAIIGISIVSYIVLLLFSGIKLVNSYSYEIDHIDEVSIDQIRKIYSLSANRSLNNNKLTYLYNTKEYEMIIENNKIIITPGYQVVLDNYSGKFLMKEECLYLAHNKGDILVGC